MDFGRSLGVAPDIHPYLEAELELGWILAGVQVAPGERADGSGSTLGIAEGERSPKRTHFWFCISSVFSKKNNIMIKEKHCKIFWVPTALMVFQRKGRREIKKSLFQKKFVVILCLSETL